MKTTQKYFSILLFFIVIAVVGYRWWLAYAMLHPLSMTVTGFQGSASINGKPLVEEGISLRAEQSVIKVEDGSILNIKLSDGTFFQAFENTSATIEKARTNRDKTRFDLEFKLDTGEIMRNIPNVRKTSEGYSSSLFTNEVNIGVRGTRYAAVAEQGLTKTMVYRGHVALGTEGQQDTPLSKGYGTVTRQGEVPEKPSKLPDPPDLTSTFNGNRIEVASINISWQPAVQASQYLLEIATDKEFNLIVYRRYTSNPVYMIEQLPFDANFFWRVASIDQRGLRGISSAPDAFQYKYHHGVLKQQSGNKDYIDQVHRAIKGFPDDTALLKDIAKYMLSIDDNKKALDYYDTIMKHEKPDPDVLVGRGTALRLLGKNDLAEIDFGKVLSMPTDGTTALYNLGLIELDRGDAEKAIEYFYQVIVQNPGHNKVHISAARAWQKIGNKEKARRHLELHGEKYPDDPEAHQLKAYIERSSG